MTLLPEDLAPEMITNAPSSRALSHHYAHEITWAVEAGLLCADDGDLFLTDRGQSHLRALEDLRVTPDGMHGARATGGGFVDAVRVQALLDAIEVDPLAATAVVTWLSRYGSRL